MHSLLKHKMLGLTLKISLYMSSTCFGPFGPSSGSMRRNLAKVTVFVEIISKNTWLKLLLCCGNMCFSLCSSVCTGCCAACDTSRTAPSVLIRSAFVGKNVLNLSKCTVKKQLKLVVNKGLRFQYFM
jgi:hypothetical protein